MLRDRLVCGIAEERWQKRLLAEEKLTFETALKISLALEAADRQVKDLHNATGTQVLLVRNSPAVKSARSTPCYRCGGSHQPHTCRFKEAECHHCKRKGHIAKACRSRNKTQPQSSSRRRPIKVAHQLQEDRDPTSERPDAAGTLHVKEYPLYNCTDGSSKPILVTVTADGAELQMEVDTGATSSIISEKTYKKIWSTQNSPPLEPARTKLKTYTGEAICVKGVINVRVEINGQKATLPLLVVEGNGPSLLGRDWLQKIQLDWSKIHPVHSVSQCQLQEILDKHPEVFKNELGQIKNTKAKIFVDAEARPRFFRPRPVPYALRHKIEAELDHLEQRGVIEPVQISDWAAPIVPVLKKDGSVRICGDYKVTVNQVAKNDTSFAKNRGHFCIFSWRYLLLKTGYGPSYQQIPLDDDSKQYVTINTHKGLYRYNRLPFGIASAPSIFQRTMESLFRGIPGVAVYIDDILVTGKTDTEHLENLNLVLKRLKESGIRLKKDKCSFKLPSVEYLGHKVSVAGLQPTDVKVQAIRDAPAPQDVSQLKSFLGLINYYGKFLPNLSSILSPLYRLLQSSTRWSWGPEQKEAFQMVKSMLTSDCL